MGIEESGDDVASYTIHIPKTVFWAAVILIPSLIFGTAWWARGQSGDLSNLTENIAAMRQQVTDMSRDVTAADSRIARLEEQFKIILTTRK